MKQVNSASTVHRTSCELARYEVIERESRKKEMEETDAQDGVKQGVTIFCKTQPKGTADAEEKRVWLQARVRTSSICPPWTPAVASHSVHQQVQNREPLLLEIQWKTYDSGQLRARSEICAPLRSCPRPGRRVRLAEDRQQHASSIFETALITWRSPATHPHHPLPPPVARTPREPAAQTGKERWSPRGAQTDDDRRAHQAGCADACLGVWRFGETRVTKISSCSVEKRQASPCEPTSETAVGRYLARDLSQAQRARHRVFLSPSRTISNVSHGLLLLSCEHHAECCSIFRA